MKEKSPSISYLQAIFLGIVCFFLGGGIIGIIGYLIFPISIPFQLTGYYDTHRTPFHQEDRINSTPPEGKILRALTAEKLCIIDSPSVVVYASIDHDDTLFDCKISTPSTTSIIRTESGKTYAIKGIKGRGEQCMVDGGSVATIITHPSLLTAGSFIQESIIVDENYFIREVALPMHSLREFERYAEVAPEIWEIIDEKERERMEQIRQQAQEYEECESNITLQ